jgi:fatty acid desaturase
MQGNNRWAFPKMEFLQKVKYGGAVGKKTAITIVALTVLGVAITGVIAFAFRIRIESIVLVVAILAVIVGLASLAVFVFKHALGSIDTTLKDHPELALMDGAEFAAAKNKVVIDVTPAIPNPKHPTAAIASAIEPAEEEQ